MTASQMIVNSSTNRSFLSYFDQCDINLVEGVEASSAFILEYLDPEYIYLPLDAQLILWTKWCDCGD